MSNQRVIYLITGPSHIPYLVASVWSLRQRGGYVGEVLVPTHPESQDVMDQVANDERLGITWVPRKKPEDIRRNSTFVDKVRVLGDYADSGCVFLDADTLVMKPIDALFQCLQDHPMVVPQFSDWTCTKGVVKKRIHRVMTAIGTSHAQYLYNRVVNNAYPSVNNGVLACRDSPLLDEWDAMATAASRCFIPDESTLHLLTGTPDFESSSIVLPHTAGFNESPKYGKCEDPVIWHFHGDSHVRPSKCPAGVRRWWPIFLDALNENAGDMQEWLEPGFNDKIDKLW
jgi:hypothetical protein